MMPENDPKHLLRIHFSLRPQIGEVEPQRMLRHTQAQLAVWAVGGQQAAFEHLFEITAQLVYFPGDVLSRMGVRVN